MSYDERKSMNDLITNQESSKKWEQALPLVFISFEFKLGRRSAPMKQRQMLKKTTKEKNDGAAN